MGQKLHLPPEPLMDSLDFGLRRTGIYVSLGIIFVIYTPLGVGISYAYIRELMEEFSWKTLAAYAWLITFYLSLALLVVLAVTNAFWIRFEEDGVWALTFRGRRFFPWNTVSDAYVLSVKGGYSLCVVSSKGIFSIPLDGFSKQASLVRAIEKRTNLRVRIPDFLRERIIDA